jgi:hypothetical protein
MFVFQNDDSRIWPELLSTGQLPKLVSILACRTLEEAGMRVAHLLMTTTLVAFMGSAALAAQAPPPPPGNASISISLGDIGKPPVLVVIDKKYSQTFTDGLSYEDVAYETASGVKVKDFHWEIDRFTGQMRILADATIFKGVGCDVCDELNVGIDPKHNRFGIPGSTKFYLTLFGEKFPAGQKVTYTWWFTSDAPEPNSWALMITGLGAIGAATRRRRRRPGPEALDA